MKNITLNPTLKKILIRSSCVVGSLCAYIILIGCIHSMEYMADYDWQFSVYAITRFAVSLALIWLNLIKLDKHLRRLVTAMFVLAYALVVFWYKAEPMLWQAYYQTLYLIGLIFVLSASLLPIWLKNKQFYRLAIYSKITVWVAVLFMDFAVSMPCIWHIDSATQRIYVGHIPNHAPNPKLLSSYLPIYAFTTEGQLNGFNDDVDICVVSPDFYGIYTSRIYRHSWNSDFIVDTLARDTIWLCEYGVNYRPERKTMENVEHIALRHHWQYRVWQQLKKTFGRKDN